MNESLFDLMGQAKAMLLDRPEIEQYLIYQIAILNAEERAAIILAYQNLYPMTKNGEYSQDNE